LAAEHRCPVDIDAPDLQGRKGPQERLVLRKVRRGGRDHGDVRVHETVPDGSHEGGPGAELDVPDDAQLPHGLDAVGEPHRAEQVADPVVRVELAADPTVEVRDDRTIGGLVGDAVRHLPERLDGRLHEG
jgi:hypothetical protein